MTAWAGAWLAAANALAVWWWSEEKQAVDVCQLVLIVEVYLSVGSS